MSRELSQVEKLQLKVIALTEENERLLAALTDLLNDLRERADLHEDGCRVLACGNGVLYQAEKALKGEE